MCALRRLGRDSRLAHVVLTVRNVLLVAGREARSAFDSPIAYVFIVLFLAITTSSFLATFFAIGLADVRGIFDLMPWTFLFFLPALTMRLWSEEHKTRTIELLLTLPLRTWEVVLGKFVAALAILALALALSAVLPATVSLYGDLDWGAVAASYLGALLLGSCYIAIGLVASYATESQPVAFIAAAVAAFVLLVAGHPVVVRLVEGAAPGPIAIVLATIGLASHYESIARGVLDSRDIIYYICVTAVLLHANAILAEHRRT